jgi:hypothetical protein
MPTVLVEERLDITDYMPDCFGTGDCLIISEDTLHVVDYKHGKGVKVEAPHNPQLMLYALGAYKGWSLIHELKHIKFTIYQPRIDNVAEWECSVEELLNFGELVRAKVKEIENNPTFRPTEEGCRFCKARATCRARANHFLEIAGFTDKEPDLIDPSEVKAMIDKGSGIDKWLSDLKEWALKECLSGHEVPGLRRYMVALTEYGGIKRVPLRLSKTTVTTRQFFTKGSLSRFQPRRNSSVRRTSSLSLGDIYPSHPENLLS